MRISPKILTLLISGLFWAAAVSPAKEKSKTGVLAKETFIDSAFGYRTTVAGMWKAKTKEEPSLLRLAMEKGDLQINPRHSAERSNAGTRPRFLILADTTALPPDDFINLLFGDKSWKKRGEYLKVLDWRPLDKELERKRVTVAGLPGAQVTFVRDMTVYFGESRSPDPGSEIRAQVVTCFKKENRIFVTVLFSSHFFLEGNFKDAMPVFNEWKFLDALQPADAEAPKTGR